MRFPVHPTRGRGAGDVCRGVNTFSGKGGQTLSSLRCGTSPQCLTYLPHLEISVRLKGRDIVRLPLLILHILGGTLALIAGTIAMTVRKGDRWHRLSGNIFTIAMLTLAASGFWLAIFKWQISNVISAVLTFYLVGSSWLAGRRREGTGLLDWTGLCLCLGSAAGVLTLGIRAVHSGTGTDNGAPAVMSFLFGGILLTAGFGDIRVLANRGISGRPRIVRHLWRMCVALFIATGSFFLGQPQVFPAALRGSIFLIVPAVLPLPLLIFWLIRVRLRNVYRLQPRPIPARFLKRSTSRSVEQGHAEKALVNQGMTGPPLSAAPADSAAYK